MAAVKKRMWRFLALDIKVKTDMSLTAVKEQGSDFICTEKVTVVFFCGKRWQSNSYTKKEKMH